MSGGRTVWWGKDAGWWRRERIVELGEEFGADGPAVIDWLTCEAKAQNDRGRVKAGRKSLARGSFVDLVTVGHILSRAVTLCLLEDFEEDNGLFTCRISGWQADQEKMSAAERKARQRAQGPVKPDDPGSLSRLVTESPGESRSVTKCPTTGQDRTDTSTANAVDKPRKRVSRSRVNQSEPPEGFPQQLIPAGATVLPILKRIWEARGGVEPKARGVGLAIMRNPKADHGEVAQQLEHWLTSGKGSHAQCGDVTARFGDWVANAGAAQRPAAVVPFERRPSAGDLIRKLNEAEEAS